MNKYTQNELQTLYLL